jgi:site-specific DNA-methyltransferase (adenine-specific)
MRPYYEDDSVTLYHGRCEDILPGLSLSGDVHLLTDPPYFQVKDDAWDNQWDKASEFLDWMGEWLGLVKPHLSANASVWVFASPQLTSAVESVVAQQFRVLNSVRWAKDGGDNLRRVSLPSMRSFVSIWEGIVFAEQAADPYGDMSDALHRKVFAPLGTYFRESWEAAGMAASAVGKALGYDSALPVRWAEGSSLPSESGYARLQELVGVARLPRSYEALRTEFEALRTEFEALRTEFEALRRPFTVASRQLSEDIWRFPSVAHYPGKHPCEKPTGLLTHMIETTTRPGDTIIDCFAGSGAVLDVARQLGRRAVGIEMDAHWCSKAAQRLSQQAFDFSVLEAS